MIDQIYELASAFPEFNALSMDRQGELCIQIGKSISSPAEIQAAIAKSIK